MDRFIEMEKFSTYYHNFFLVPFDSEELRNIFDNIFPDNKSACIEWVRYIKSVNIIFIIQRNF